MQVNWGAVAVGGLAGLVAGAVLAGILVALGLAGTDTFGGQSVLMTVAFFAQVLAGFVAARFGGRHRSPALHGALAAPGLFGVIAAVSIAAGSEPSVATLAFGAIVAVVLGMAGGVLAAAISEHSG